MNDEPPKGKSKSKAKKIKKDAPWPANQVELSGYAGSDPVFEKKGEGRLLARFTLGTHQLYRDTQGRWIRTTVWHTVVAWDYCAKSVIEKVRKGSFVSLKGRLRGVKTNTPDGRVTDYRILITASSVTSNLAV